MVPATANRLLVHAAGRAAARFLLCRNEQSGKLRAHGCEQNADDAKKSGRDRFTPYRLKLALGCAQHLEVLNMRKVIAAAVLGSMLACGAVAMAQMYPRHPELSAAATHLEQALKALGEARANDKGEFGGHRDKAEQLCNQALQAVHQAVAYANAHEKK